MFSQASEAHVADRFWSRVMTRISRMKDRVELELSLFFCSGLIRGITELVSLTLTSIIFSLPAAGHNSRKNVG